MPGVVRCLREVVKQPWLVVGLENYLCHERYELEANGEILGR